MSSPKSDGQPSLRRSMECDTIGRLSGTARKSQYYRGDCIDTDGTIIRDVELKVTERIPGVLASELPRAVFISSEPAPKPKGEK